MLPSVSIIKDSFNVINYKRMDGVSGMEGAQDDDQQ